LSYGGHGGYRWNYKIEQRDIDLEPFIRKDERENVKTEIENLKQEKTRLEQKWSVNKKEYENKLRELRENLKTKSDELERTEWLHFDDMIKELEKNNEMECQLSEYKKRYDVPIHRIIMQRARIFFQGLKR